MLNRFCRVSLRWGTQLEAAQARMDEIDAQLGDLLSGIPNLLQQDVPDGADESANRELRRWGRLRNFDFPVRDHVELGEQSGLLRFDIAAKLSGSRFAVLEGFSRRAAPRADPVHARCPYP